VALQKYHDFRHAQNVDGERLGQPIRETAKMDSRSNLQKFVLAGAAVFLSSAMTGSLAQAQATPAQSSNQESPALRDGQHDFDFNVGVWHTQIKR